MPTPDPKIIHVENAKPRTMAMGDMGSAFEPSSWNEEAGTVDLVILSANHRIRRYHPMAGKVVDEVFSFEPGHVRTERMSRGLPLLYGHRDWDHEDLLGKVEGCSCSPTTGMRGKARFSNREDAELAGIKQDVKDGILDGVSLGTIVYAYQITQSGDGGFDEWRAIDHEPIECSLTPIQADPGSRTQSLQTGGNATEDSQMPQTDNAPQAPAQTTSQAVEVERANMLTLMSRANSLGVPLDAVHSVIAQNLSLEAATDQIIATAARLNAAKKPENKEPEQTLPTGQARTMAVTEDQAQKDGQAIIEYILHKEMPSQNKLTDGAKRFMGYSAVDICRYVVEKNGVQTMGMPRDEIVQRAMTPVRKNDIGGVQTTSDFPNLLGDGLLNRSLLQAYERTPDSYSSLVSETTFADTRSKNFLQIGNLGPLRKVLEAAEYKRVTLGESKESLNIDKYGEIFGLSLEAILNDDLSAFVRLPAAFGKAAKLTEEAIVFGLLVTNPTLATDGKVVFHADHANIGSASAPDVTGITDARTLMRKQKGLTAAAGRLGIKPKYVVAPLKYELGLAQIMGQANYVPNTTDEIVPGYIRGMEYVISDVIDEESTQVWYGVADPAVIECIVVARLQGGQSFRVFQKEGWNVDGMEWKVRHWFGAGIVDYRGLYRNPGV